MIFIHFSGKKEEKKLMVGKKQNILKKTVCILTVFTLTLGMVANIDSFADENNQTYIVNSQFYGKFGDAVETAKSQGKSIIKVTSDQNSMGNVNIASPIAKLYGDVTPTRYNKGRVSLGYIAKDVVTFKSGSDVEVKNIDFRNGRGRDDQGAYVVIEEGARVKFINCNFDNLVVNNGNATFENSSFKNKNNNVNNHGILTTVADGGTTRLGNSSNPSIGLSINLDYSGAFTRVVGLDENDQVGYTLAGDNKENALVEVSISPEGSGLTARVSSDNKISLTGAPIKIGDYTLKIKATANNEVAEKELKINVLNTMRAFLKGNAPIYGFIGNKSYSSNGGIDVVSAATGGGVINSADSGKISVLVKEGTESDAKYLPYYEFKQKYPNAKIELSISPDGSGLRAELNPISYINKESVVNIEGEAKGPEALYKLTAKVTDGSRVSTTNSVDIHVYDLTKSLQARLDALDSKTSKWMMMPYKIFTVGTTTIPTNLKEIAGSNEEGLYGELGNTDSYATETIIIPKGADATLKNLKIKSSTKIIVEKGGKLTLDGCVTYGPIEVNGGSLTVKDNSSTTNTITLNDGSTLENSSIKSLSTFLTDGSTLAPKEPKSVVIVNGNITVKGTNKIKGDKGFTTSVEAQNGLRVNNGVVTLDKNASLEVIGGGDNVKTNNPFSTVGADAIVLENAKIIGEGTLIATGGRGYVDTINQKDGKGGNAVSGTGVIDVSVAKLTGGEGRKDDILNTKKAIGGNAATPNIKVRAKNGTYKGGDGDPKGSSLVTPYSDNASYHSLNGGVSSSEAPFKRSVSNKRISGDDRIATAIELSKKNFERANTVIIARSDIFPDSMTASVLAKALNAPILLTKNNSLDPRVESEIERLGAKDLIIVGGNSSVNKDVEKALSKYDSVIERLAGSDRYETSELVARKVISVSGNKNTAVISSGESFPDALAISPYASKEAYPILLVKRDSIPSNIKRLIDTSDLKNVYIVGGLNTISKDVENKLANTIERFSGKDRYETSIKIANSKFKDSKKAYLASGKIFADALVAGPIAGKDVAPILLAPDNGISNDLKNYIDNHKINDLVVVGGYKYLPESAIRSILK